MCFITSITTKSFYPGVKYDRAEEKRRNDRNKKQIQRNEPGMARFADLVHVGNYLT